MNEWMNEWIKIINENKFKKNVKQIAIKQAQKHALYVLAVNIHVKQNESNLKYRKTQLPQQTVKTRINP